MNRFNKSIINNWAVSIKFIPIYSPSWHGQGDVYVSPYTLNREIRRIKSQNNNKANTNSTAIWTGLFLEKVNSILEKGAYFSLLLSSGPIHNGKVTYFHCNISLRNNRMPFKLTNGDFFWNRRSMSDIVSFNNNNNNNKRAPYNRPLRPRG